jgi:hypothetical protein
MIGSPIQAVKGKNPGQKSEISRRRGIREHKKRDQASFGVAVV